MFSNHLTGVRKPYPMALLAGLAAGLGFLSLLAALVWVLDGQVERSRLRQVQYHLAQVALSDCSENYSGVARRQCIDQVNAGLAPYSTYTPEIEVATNAESLQPMQPAGPAQPSPVPATAGAQRFVQALFIPR